jgi:hypothetical protein
MGIQVAEVASVRLLPIGERQLHVPENARRMGNCEFLFFANEERLIVQLAARVLA